MRPDDDEVLTSAYADLARPTAPLEEPVAAVRRQMRRRAQRQKRFAALAAAALLAVLGVGVYASTRSPATPSSAAGGGVASPSGALPQAGAQSCAIGYSRQALAKSGWAADATVTDIGRGQTTVTVELDVNRWYRGGSSQTLKVRLPNPGVQTEDAPPAYGLGTRLLLSGSGGEGGRLPWSCGFTRYYDPRTAAVWAKVFTR